MAMDFSSILSGAASGLGSMVVGVVDLPQMGHKQYS